LKITLTLEDRQRLEEFMSSLPDDLPAVSGGAEVEHA
jgi:hypothetical protein